MILVAIFVILVNAQGSSRDQVWIKDRWQKGNQLRHGLKVKVVGSNPVASKFFNLKFSAKVSSCHNFAYIR